MLHINQENIDAKLQAAQLKQQAQQQNQSQREQMMNLLYTNWVIAFNKQLGKKAYLLNAAQTVFNYSKENEDFRNAAVKLWGNK